ncbi:hypothetical protein M8J76_013581 [Diaphorina citri]|nr:hypothetical protein M8J76_013581 [Diaphorina citri]
MSENKDFKTILETMNNINKRLAEDSEERKELLKDSKDMKDSLDKILKEVEGVRGEVRESATRIDHIEKEKRKRNVLLFGINERDKETMDDLEKSVMEIAAKMKVNLKLEEIDNICRMGKNKEEGKNRPILVSLTTLRRKNEMMKNKRELKNTNIYIKEHFTKEVVEKRKALMSKAMKLREQGKYAVVKFDKLVIKENESNSGTKNKRAAVDSISPEMALQPSQQENNRRILKRGKREKNIASTPTSSSYQSKLDSFVNYERKGSTVSISDDDMNVGTEETEEIDDVLGDRAEILSITKVLCMNVEHGITGSDHFPITLQLQVDWNQEEEEEDKEERDMNKSTYYKMKWKEDKKKQYEEETQEILRENFDKVNREDGIELTNLLKRTIKEVAFKEGMVERIIYPRMPRRNNWFNRECKEMKFKVRQQLRIWKRWRSNEEMRKYLDMKRKYKKMKETRKKEVREEMKNKIANVKNAAQFWEVIRKVKPMKDTNCISIENWEKHLRSTHECEDESRAKIELLLYDASREYFDKDITIEELARAMKKMKNKKAPGPDEGSHLYLYPQCSMFICLYKVLECENVALQSLHV